MFQIAHFKKMTHHMYASVYPGKSAIYVSLVRASNLDIAGPEDITGLLAVVTFGREISSREYCIVRLPTFVSSSSGKSLKPSDVCLSWLGQVVDIEAVRSFGVASTGL